MDDSEDIAIPSHHCFGVRANGKPKGNGTGNRPMAPGDLVLTKKYFKLLQAIHHSEILAHSASTGSSPPGMSRQVMKLAAFIKPASPTVETLEKVKQNTVEWLENNLCILREHYDSVLALGLEALPSFNEEAFHKAVQWSRVRYRRRFTTSSAETLRTMLQATLMVEDGDTLDLADHVEFPPLPGRHPPEKRLSYVQVLASPQTVVIPQVITPRPITSLPPPREKRGLALEKVLLSPLPTETPPPPLPPPHVVQIGAEPGPDLFENITFSLREDPSSGEDGEISSPPVQSSPSSRITDLGTVSRGLPFLSNVANTCSNSILSASPLDPVPQVPNRVAEHPVTAMVGLGGDMMMGNNTKDDSHPNVSQSESPPKHLKTSLPTVNAQSIRREPLRHPNTNRKIHEWNLKVVKPILIIGDSNLARIPYFWDPRVQVDSFPGANFYHLRGILEKLEPHQNVERVILSAGLNNCLSGQLSSTIWKQLQQLLKTCETVFPNAELYLPVINFSDRLSKEAQSLLRLLNQSIIDKCNYLPEISRLRFQTAPKDPVHWTAETAQEILKFWLDQLNM